MASYTKKVSRGIGSKSVHSEQNIILPSRQARSYISSYRTFHIAKDTILTIIVLVMLIVTGYTFFALIATPEFLVKREIESIATDYYENYFYTTILNNNSIDLHDSSDDTTSTIAKIFGRYEVPGFAKVTLRQLLLYDNYKYAGATTSLNKYCDLDKTQIKIYPKPDFGRQDYQVDYDYSCKFK